MAERKRSSSLSSSEFFEEKCAEVGVVEACEWFATKLGIEAIQMLHVLRHPVGLSLFTQFCKKEFSEENIGFWKDVTKYKTFSEIHKTTQLHFAEAIISRYITDEAASQVNISSEQKNMILDALADKSIDSTTFDIALDEVYRMMAKDSFSRFKNTSQFKGLLNKMVSGGFGLGTVKFGLIYIPRRDVLVLHMEALNKLQPLKDGTLWSVRVYASIRTMHDTAAPEVMKAETKHTRSGPMCLADDTFYLTLEKKSTRQGKFIDILVCAEKKHSKNDKIPVYAFLSLPLHEVPTMSSRHLRTEVPGVEELEKNQVIRMNNKMIILAHMKWNTTSCVQCPSFVAQHYKKFDPAPACFAHVQDSKASEVDDNDNSIFAANVRANQRENMSKSKIARMMAASQNQDDPASSAPSFEATNDVLRVPTASARAHRRGPSTGDHWRDEMLGKCLYNVTYDSDSQKLCVHVLRCMELPVLNSGDPLSPYVKLYLINASSGALEAKKQKTDVVLNNSNPIYNQRFYFSITPEKLAPLQLEITVWDDDGTFVGCVAVMMSTVDLSDVDRLPRWRPFWPESLYVSSQQSVLHKVFKRDVRKSLFSNPSTGQRESFTGPAHPRRDSLTKRNSTNATRNSEKYLQSRRSSQMNRKARIRTNVYHDEKTHTLHVEVIECMHLYKEQGLVDTHENSESFVKLYLVKKEDHSAVGNKKKTEMCKGSSPAYDFETKYTIVSGLDTMSLEMTVWQYERASANILLGSYLLDLQDIPKKRVASAWNTLDLENTKDAPKGKLDRFGSFLGRKLSITSPQPSTRRSLQLPTGRAPLSSPPMTRSSLISPAVARTNRRTASSEQRRTNTASALPKNIPHHRRNKPVLVSPGKAEEKTKQNNHGNFTVME